MCKGDVEVDLKNMTAKEVCDIISRRKKIKITDDEWLEIEKWVDEFLRSNPPPEEKKMFVPLGWAEALFIICDGIRRWRISICIKCKMQQGCGKYSCSIYQTDEKQRGGIPNAIWANEKAECPYFEPMNR